jgi:predicted ATPase
MFLDRWPQSWIAWKESYALPQTRTTSLKPWRASAGRSRSRGQAARSWELRAASSLARLLVAAGRRDEARRSLAGVYDWFTEGFDTPDLGEAKALLDDLATT